MLTTARQLAAGLGAPPSKSQDPQLHDSDNTAMGTTRKVGNAPLGLWIGQRFLGEAATVQEATDNGINCFAELYRRTGRDKRARRQGDINSELIRGVEEIDSRGRSVHHTPEVDDDVHMSP